LQGSLKATAAFPLVAVKQVVSETSVALVNAKKGKDYKSTLQEGMVSHVFSLNRKSIQKVQVEKCRLHAAAAVGVLQDEADRGTLGWTWMKEKTHSGRENLATFLPPHFGNAGAFLSGSVSKKST
jgi:hypothetical protein